MDDLSEFLGPTLRWLDGDILHTENNFTSYAWACTDDPAKVGKHGWHGPRRICVEYVGREQWDAAVAKLDNGGWLYHFACWLDTRMHGFLLKGGLRGAVAGLVHRGAHEMALLCRNERLW